MIETVQIIAVLFFSVILHECAHGIVALWCGDATARDAGRLTLNPLKHIDPFGTIILPIALRLLHVFPIGWAKPVPVNFARLRRPKRDMLWVGMAGPLTNIMIAVLASGVFHFSHWHVPVMRDFLTIVIAVNLMLALFNMTPIPPLDGSRLVFSLLPDSWAYQYAKLERFGIIIVLVLLNFGLFDIIITLVQMAMRFLIGRNI